MKNKTVLAIGAHHDDAQIGVGRALFSHIKNKDKVYIAVTSSDEGRTGSIDIRRAEEYDVLQKMGIPKNRLFTFYKNDGVRFAKYVQDVQDNKNRD